MTYQQTLKTHILDEATFVTAEFNGVQRGHTMRWQRLELRPLQLKNGRFIQFSYFDDKQHIAKNYAADELETALDEALALPFKNWNLTHTNGRLRVQITKKGKAIVHEDKAQQPIDLPVLAHDRPKQHILSEDEPVPFLQAVGIMTANGRVKANMRRKFRQINQFLMLIAETADFGSEASLNVVDFGCGNAYLTLAAYHYFHNALSVPTQLTGIDIKEKLVRRHNQTAKELGWDGVRFLAQPIDSYQPPMPPDIVLALHACDTATDDALAQAIRSHSRYIFSAPCCHHHLQAQLNQQASPAPFTAVVRHGILKERLGDILTDAFRALILRIMGYRTDVIEFIDTQHTPRNLMIRAVKTSAPGDPQFVAEYREMKAFWQVTPYLETLLGAELPVKSEK